MLRHAYFQEFKSGATLLIWGDTDDMKHLADIFRAAAEGTSTITLGDLPDCQSVDGVVVRLGPVITNGGVRQDRVNGRLLHWEAGPETWRQFAELVEPLCSMPGHQYLESRFDELTVMASCGEYSPDLKPNK